MSSLCALVLLWCWDQPASTLLVGVSGLGRCLCLAESCESYCLLAALTCA